MRSQNWLFNYKSIEGISKILWGMDKRTKGISKMNLAKEDLIKNYEEFQEDFTYFFSDLKKFSDNYIDNNFDDRKLLKK